MDLTPLIIKFRNLYAKNLLYSIVKAHFTFSSTLFASRFVLFLDIFSGSFVVLSCLYIDRLK